MPRKVTRSKSKSKKRVKRTTRAKSIKKASSRKSSRTIRRRKPSRTKIIVIRGSPATVSGTGVKPRTVIGPGGNKSCQPSTGWARNYSGGWTKVNYRPCPQGSVRAGNCVRQDHVSEYDNFFTRCGMR